MNQEIREEKEREQERKWKNRRKKKMDNGIMMGNLGNTVPDYGETFFNSPPTEEEKIIHREAEQQEFKWFVEERTKKQREKRKQNDLENKKAMATPIDPLPEHELCTYEKLKENIRTLLMKRR